MLVGGTSQYLLKKTRAKAKMNEYGVPEELHIKVERETADLFILSVALIGEISIAIINHREECDKIIGESKKNLEFASRYFDAYLETQLDEGADDYYLLLGSVAYFLCDYIGSSKVLVGKLNILSLNLNAHGLEHCLGALLKNEFEHHTVKLDIDEYDELMKNIQSQYIGFFKTGQESGFEEILLLREKIYRSGSDIELFLIDAFAAIYYLRIHNSAINLLPQYTEISLDTWINTLSGGNLVKDIWPAQKELGEKGIYNGKSAVIQMPTSSGKTKAISLLIASRFLQGSTRYAVIIAPFRALCREISSDLESDFAYDEFIHINELSDILQDESTNFEMYSENEKTIIVSTPEKFIYLLKLRREIIEEIGLLIFDEGHLFDEPKRGMVYELLISMIKGLLGNRIQKILISAIIPNALQINEWLNGQEGITIANNTVKSTQRAIGFTDWGVWNQKLYANLFFVNPENLDEEEFYVPRLIPIADLEKKGRELNVRKFPDLDTQNRKVNNNDIALYYGLKLCVNGGVAIFAGKKDTANNMLNRLLDIKDRGYDISSFIKTSDNQEVQKIAALIGMNYGTDNVYYDAGKLGAFVHHAGISNGIKISIENAMREEKIHFLICTSTLAQGVNLPIRYLIITNMYQGKDKIRVRDFHNLIGRAGRSGLYTEGNIIFTETFVYNQKFNYSSGIGYKWDEYKRFLDNRNSEFCSSRILFLVQKCHIASWDDSVDVPMKDIIFNYYTDSKNFEKRYNTYNEQMRAEHPRLADNIKEVLDVTINSLGAIESFLMNYLLEDTWEECEKEIENVLRNTLAWNLATDEEKNDLQELLIVISKYCLVNVNNSSERYVCSRTLLSVRNMQKIKMFVETAEIEIMKCTTTQELYCTVFPIIKEVIQNKVYNRLKDKNCLLLLGALWITGKSYLEILSSAQENSYLIEKRRKFRKLTIDDVVNICDQIFSYDMTVIISAIYEIVNNVSKNSEGIELIFKQLATELKYGLTYGTSTVLYEMGFCDREVSKAMKNYFDSIDVLIFSKSYGKKFLKESENDISIILEDFPCVFKARLASYLQ